MNGPDRGYLHPFSDGRQFEYGVGEYPRTLVELAMNQASAWLRSKPRWWTLYRVHSIREKWAAEIMAGSWKAVSSTSSIPMHLTERQVQYVLDELAGYDALRDEFSCEVACNDRIWQSAQVLCEGALTRLNGELDHVRTPRTNLSAACVDFIDPFLYSVVYGRTLSHASTPALDSIAAPRSNMMNEFATSTRFACIPTSFLISEKEEPLKATSLSYINNIDPKNTSLYGCLEELVAGCVPLFEHVLTDLHRNNPLRQRIPDSYTYTDWDEPDEPEDSDEEDWIDYRAQLARWSLERPIDLPDVPKEGYTGGLEKRHHVVSFRGQIVQIIIRATELRLNPEEPAHRGTSWRVEGMRNEHIAACLLYCTQAVNIRPPKVSFRMAVSHPKEWQSEDVGGIWRTWGLQPLFPCHQTLGSVELRPGLGVAFPNIYQHRLDHASPVDRSKVASMTLLGLFLVDPDLVKNEELHDEELTPSTSQVPPQQKEWMKNAVEEHINIRLPNEVVEQIIEEVEGVMVEEEVYSLAEEMRHERERFRTLHDQYWFCLPFDSRR
ncbi:hypothetical protein OBBRIDRAFT_793213 [Obba rivulosa]|uniref:DUF4246 domain-containing protein n=1 Tax=Obba rivulosa TaxID=1052685 RepID=A0A8E2DKZ6_9APHY|nr:hypothetical protein OBBRIDRAFT_793213 [Obba rivulosa]